MQFELLLTTCFVPGTSSKKVRNTLKTKNEIDVMWKFSRCTGPSKGTCKNICTLGSIPLGLKYLYTSNCFLRPIRRLKAFRLESDACIS